MLTPLALSAIVAGLVGASFPELAGRRIVVREFSEPGTFFQARVDPASVWRAEPERTYVLYASPEALADPPPREALEGVLAHELSHLAGYTRMSRTALAKLAMAYLFGNEAKIASYERATDFDAAMRCYGPGLAAYKRWADARLSARQRRERARRYLSADELPHPFRCP